MSVSEMSVRPYFERVLPRWPAILPVLVIPPISYLTLLPFSEAAGLVLGVTLTLAVLAGIWFAAPQITIDDEHLEVGSATLPRRFIGEISEIEAKDAFAERGINLSPAAYTSFQPSVRTMVKVEILDPDDPTPYWLFSTRNSGLIKQLLEAQS